MTSSRIARVPLTASVAALVVSAGLTRLPVMYPDAAPAGIPVSTWASNGSLALAAASAVLLIAAVVRGRRRTEPSDGPDDQTGTEASTQSDTLTDKDAMNSFENMNSFDNILEFAVNRSDAAYEPAPLTAMTAAERKEAKAAAAAEKKRAAREAKFAKAAEKQAAKAARAAAKAARRGKHAMNTDLIEDETGTGWARSYDENTPQAAPAATDPTWVTDAYSDPTFAVPFDSTEWISAADDAAARIAALTDTLTGLLAEAEAAQAADQAEFQQMLDLAIDNANQAQADLTSQISTLRERATGLHAHIDELRAELAQTERELTAVEERATEAETALAAARLTFIESVATIATTTQERFISRLDRLRGIASARADLDDVIVAAIDNMGGSTRSDATAIQSAPTDAPE